MSGVMKIFDNYSVCPFLSQSVCTVIYIVFIEVLNGVSVSFRRHTIQFDDTVCQTFCIILFILCYISYTFYHFSIINNSTDKDGWMFMILQQICSSFCLFKVCLFGEQVITIVCFR